MVTVFVLNELSISSTGITESSFDLTTLFSPCTYALSTKSEIPASPLTLALLEASAPLLFESIAADAAITIAPTPHLRKKSLRRIKQPP